MNCCACCSNPARFDHHVCHAVERMDVLEGRVGGDGAFDRMVIGVASWRQRSQYRDDGNDGRADRRFDRGVAAQLAPRILRGHDAWALDQPRRQPQPIDGSDSDHAEEQRDLDQQQQPVLGLGERRNAANEIPAIDDAGEQERCDAYDAEHRQAQRCRARNGERIRILSRQRKQQRQRNEGADPGRRANQMQDIGGRMNNAFDPLTADGVAGEGQGPDESCGQNDRCCLEPSRLGALYRQERNEHAGENAGEDEACEPVVAEIGLRQHRPEHALRDRLRYGLAAHRCRGQDEPPRARQHGQDEADPCDPCEPRPEGYGDARVIWRLAERRFGDEDNKEDDARRQNGCGEMHGARIEYRIVHTALMPGTAPSLAVRAAPR